MPEKKRVLIVEDEKDMVSVLKIRLTSIGYDIFSAYDGQEGLSLAQKHNPDLIILDLMLPKLDGYKVCRMLKFDDKYKNIPIIIYTARSQESDRRLADECGADAFIPKTLGQEVLVDKIKKLISPAQ
ncbi:MAG: response regulator [Candidatus Omnitrophota bacterium]|nr:response regulator [Candidatus Omnitrophota bacterium]